MRTGTLDGIIHGGEFQKVYDSGELGGAITDLTISGLNGNLEKEYMLIYRIVGGANSSSYYLRYNALSASDTYGIRYLAGEATTLSAGAVTTLEQHNIAAITSTGQIAFGFMEHYAKTGFVRVAYNKLSGPIATDVVSALQYNGHSWNDTSTNITSLYIYANQTNGIGVGSRFILLRRNAQAVGARTGTLDVQGKLKGAFQKIYSTTLTGTATSATISGLNGNTDMLYRLIIRSVYGLNDNLYVYLNNDSGANYGRQQIYGISTTAGANAATGAAGITCIGGDASGDKELVDMLIYAKSGYLRTTIDQHTGYGTNFRMSLRGQVWTNTADNITSIVLAGPSANGLLAGTVLDLYAYREQ